jgi:endogenous inhibitor of DNA gyrase (YacG/DUF329 family)
MTEHEVKCLNCPICGSLPAFIHDNLASTFCPNEDCPVLAWDPWVSAATNLADMGEAKIEYRNSEEKEK